MGLVFYPILLLKTNKLYEKIEIYKTDFSEKHLLKFNDNTMYVGYIVKDIVILLQEGINKKEIYKIYKKKYNIERSDINTVITKIDDFIIQNKKSELIKLFYIVNPNNLSIPSFVKNIFFDKYFYKILLLTSIVNLYTFVFTKNNSSDTVVEQLFFLLILMLFLFLHELGHAISAINYKIKAGKIGFGLYLIFPVLYIDLGETWRLNVPKRTIINLSGIYFQLILGTILAILLTIFENVFLLTQLFHANFIIILLNLNPFIKFDGYWIISDLLGEKNLIQKSNNFFKIKSINKNNIFLILYTFLRFSFIFWMLLIVIKTMYRFINDVLNHEVTTQSFLLPLIILTLITKKLKNVLNRRKKEI
ncbi:MAG TPA: hypothetical protein EYG89_04340 [Bacteroidia bacterium]|nr:hypothetical protein [Bacteroidia bacterium]